VKFFKHDHSSRSNYSETSAFRDNGHRKEATHVLFNNHIESIDAQGYDKASGRSSSCTLFQSAEEVGTCGPDHSINCAAAYLVKRPAFPDYFTNSLCLLTNTGQEVFDLLDVHTGTLFAPF
jgi:hypothetical protein